ncbi:TPA: ArdC-like ssDNA-binding domain-containing protein [Stenotrophomonas maltophilia]
MEEGTGPFLKPWDARVDLGLPMNPTTGKNYRGGNLLHLWALQSAWDTQDNRWMTYKQAAAVGAQVRKGEKASVIEYWDLSLVEEAKKRRAGTQSSSPRPTPRSSSPGCSTRCRSMGCRHWPCHPRAQSPTSTRHAKRCSRAAGLRSTTTGATRRSTVR